jgi:predicted TIM-barrel fold metal-dependent hydrolase
MTRLVNAHDHAWTTPDRYPWVSDLTPFGVEQMVYDVDDIRADMDEHGIDRTVLIAAPIHGRGSPYTRECLRAYPDDFSGIVLLDYFADDVAERIDDVLSRENLLGVRFGAVMEWGSMWEDRNPGADWITSPDLDPFWEAIESHDAPQVQMLLEAGQLDQAEALIADHPGVNFVLDHLAWPVPGEHPPDEMPYARLESIAQHGNAYVKVTQTPSEEPYPFEDVHGHVRNLFEWFGSDHLLWGTDWVYHFKEATPWEAVHFVEELPFVSGGDLRDIRYRTYESMLP